jgi:aminopeptidase N
MRTEVVLWSRDSAPVFVPVEIRAETTVVAAAKGRRAPDFVFANANDNAYGLVMLDTQSTQWLSQHIGDVQDPLLRAMLWGAMWDLVRDARLAPSTFISTAMRELPRETDEQLAAGIVTRLSRATATYMSTAQERELVGAVERTFLGLGSDASKPYGIRKNALDAYIAMAKTPAALATLNAWLDSASTAGLPLRQPTRWMIVTHLVERGSPRADSLIAAEERRDTTSSGKRSAFVAYAARPVASVKGDYFRRYFADTTLNEEWVTASLRGFNSSDAAALTLGFLVPALDSLPWIQHNRRIFFLGSWVGSFVGGQRSGEALREVDQFLAEHPRLPLDLRQKVLQSRDDLERTVRVRAKYANDGALTP